MSIIRFVYICCASLFLSGCLNNAEIQPSNDDNKNISFQPMTIDKAPPKVKEEHFIEPTSNEEIEAYQKEQERLSDFEKMIRYHHR